MKTFTVEFMKNNCGCYSQRKLMSCSFMKEEEITLESIFKSEISSIDKLWFYYKIASDKEQNKKIALDVAEIVLPIYENKHQDDLRPRKAIEAAKQFLLNNVSLRELFEKRTNAISASLAVALNDDVAVYAASLAAQHASFYSFYLACVFAFTAAKTDAEVQKKLEQYLCDLINKLNDESSK